METRTYHIAADMNSACSTAAESSIQHTQQTNNVESERASRV